MANIIKYEAVSDKIVKLGEQDVILDFAVAELYGVQTKEINQAVKNNPKKFPNGYVFEVDRQQFADLRSKNLTTNNMSRTLPKAFTEKGLNTPPYHTISFGTGLRRRGWQLQYLPFCLAYMV